MAKKKISELTAAGAITGTEQVPVVQSGATKRTTIADLLATLNGTYALSANLAFNVKETPYSATGNGTTDDTAAIQAAINAASAAASSAEAGSNTNRGVVYLPPGRYAVTNLTLKANVAIIGAGYRITALIATASSGYVLGTSGISHGTRMANVHLEGFTIGPTAQLSGLASPRPACSGIDLKYSTWCYMRDVFIHNLAGIGINCLETFDLNTQNCHVVYTGTDGDSPGLYLNEGTNDGANANHHVGLRIEQCPVMLRAAGTAHAPFNNQFIGCKFEWHTNVTLTHDGAGIRIDNAKQMTFDACHFVTDDDTYPVIRLDPASGTNTGVHFIGCEWIAPTQYVGWALDVANDVADCQIVGGHMTQFLKGMVFADGPGPQIIGFTAADCTAPVIDGVRVTVMGCRFNAIRAASATFTAIKASSASRVIGNYIDGTQPNVDGISVGNASIVAFNTLQDLVGGIFLSGTGATVRNNKFTNTTLDYNGAAGFLDNNFIERGSGSAISPVSEALQYQVRQLTTGVVQSHDGTDWRDLLRGVKFPATFVGPVTTTAAGVATNNDAHYARVYSGGTITKVAVNVGNATGNMSVACYRNSGVGQAAVPGTQLITTGAIAIPGTGQQEIALGGSVTLNEGDWIGISFASTTATIIRVSTGSGTDLYKGMAYQQATAHPCPSTPSSLVATGSRLPLLVGVA